MKHETPISAQNQLPEIPVLSLGQGNWPVEALKADIERCHIILDHAQDFMPHVPKLAIKTIDRISRRWLVGRDMSWLGEIDEISAILDRPGAFALNVAYEWACTARVAASQDQGSAELVRILDWPFRGIGEQITAQRISSDIGDWLNLSWPGFTGVLQAVAKGRFAAALNQAPLEKHLNIRPSIGIPLDWAASRLRVWRSSAPAPVHLLRQVFEQAKSYEEAKQTLCHHPIAIPAIFILSGIRAGEGCVIERQREGFSCFETPACAANHWQTQGWTGYPRAALNPERSDQLGNVDLSDSFPLSPMSYQKGAGFSPFAWLEYPMLNQYSRVAMMADAKTGEVVMQGIEDFQPATQPLELFL